MKNQLPVHAFASLNKAAALDVDLLDLSCISETASDRTHAALPKVLDVAQQRFDTALKAALSLVPLHLHETALDFICDRADEIMLDRYERAQRRAFVKPVNDFMRIKVSKAKRYNANLRETDALIAAAL